MENEIGKEVFQKEEAFENSEELKEGMYEFVKTEKGLDMGPEEMRLAMNLADIVHETELPEFESVDVTSVTNSKVKGKAELIFAIPEIADSAIPETLKSEYPVQYDEETLKKAPWVNMVHAWNKTFNYLIPISKYQKEERTKFVEPRTVLAIAQVLYRSTTNADDNVCMRSDREFLEGKKYVETLLREGGAKGVNATRHVCFEEMSYILKTIQESFKKKD